MRKVHSIYCEHWNQQLWLCIGSSKSHFLKALSVQTGIDHTEIDFDFETNDGYMYEHGDAIFIWLRKGDKAFLGSLAHECVHAATLILKARGVILDPENDEPLAYLTQYLFNSCLKHMGVK